MIAALNTISDEFHNENYELENNMNFGVFLLFDMRDQFDAGRISNSLSRLEVDSKSAPSP